MDYYCLSCHIFHLKKHTQHFEPYGLHNIAITPSTHKNYPALFRLDFSELNMDMHCWQHESYNPKNPATYFGELHHTLYIYNIFVKCIC